MLSPLTEGVKIVAASTALRGIVSGRVPPGMLRSIQAIALGTCRLDESPDEVEAGLGYLLPSAVNGQ